MADTVHGVGWRFISIVDDLTLAQGQFVSLLFFSLKELFKKFPSTSLIVSLYLIMLSQNCLLFRQKIHILGN